MYWLRHMRKVCPVEGSAVIVKVQILLFDLKIYDSKRKSSL